MGQYGHRNMYYLTGLPGWMRFGYSPGWVGRSPTGLGPAAQYLMTGQWPTPQMQAYWNAMQTGAVPGMAQPFYGSATPEQELEFLKNQAQMLNEQLKRINQRIAELEKSK
ncbi:hypothetical protein DRP98_09220 [candidate division KSB1 bacterium]|nr:DUF5320 domain-containing protein [bacterium]RKY79497.1 MAG: hypothetical protein DRQ12_03615 [candidate division KSB1 bacterium]RKY81034.1 MAG: hypothetical protein DRQ00_00855 [candidate division KSB1 bacterium]RKY82281.1 MAG: hypothetical protein DRP98_09220 [candidate division KSB1 bacterium]RKY88469.1 MAG: hypothetical protein DRQ11_03665 [candidate division KSB1 bacterium]